MAWIIIAGITAFAADHLASYHLTPKPGVHPPRDVDVADQSIASRVDNIRKSGFEKIDVALKSFTAMEMDASHTLSVTSSLPSAVFAAADSHTLTTAFAPLSDLFVPLPANSTVLDLEDMHATAINEMVFNLMEDIAYEMAMQVVDDHNPTPTSKVAQPDEPHPVKTNDPWALERREPKESPNRPFHKFTTWNRTTGKPIERPHNPSDREARIHDRVKFLDEHRIPHRLYRMDRNGVRLPVEIRVEDLHGRLVAAPPSRPPPAFTRRSVTVVSPSGVEVEGCLISRSTETALDAMTEDGYRELYERGVVRGEMLSRDDVRWIWNASAPVVPNKRLVEHRLEVDPVGTDG